MQIDLKIETDHMFEFNFISWRINYVILQSNFEYRQAWHLSTLMQKPSAGCGEL